MSFFEELKRRNVVRVGIAYAVVAWLILQFSDVILNNIEAPPWLFHSILLLLAIGFAVVLVFAWAFEMTPEGIKRERDVDRTASITTQTGRKLDRVIIVVLVVALGYFVYDKFSPAADRAAGLSPMTAQSASEKQAPGTQDQRKSIAVLPFANMSNDPANEPFTLGIHDDLLTHLSRISALRTISRTSVLQYRDTTKTIPEIAAELGVGAVLEGGIQRSGDRVRINLQLIDADTDEHLWAEIYDRELTAENLFDVQGAIATEVAKSLRATLLPSEEKALQNKPTRSMAAYDLYLLGRHHWNQRTAESIDLAIDYFNQAIEADPDYVLAQSGLADAYVLAESYGNLTGSEAFPKAKAAINRAMALDDGLSEVWASRGLLRQAQGYEEEAATDLEKAIELDPQNFSAWIWYGNVLTTMRRYEEALAAQEMAYSLEPMSRPANNNLAFAYRARGRFAESRPHFERVDQLDQSDTMQYRQYIADTYIRSGQLSRAAIELRQVLAIDPGNRWAMEQLRDVYLMLGDFAEAKYWVEQAAPLDQFAPIAYAYLLATGDYEGAIAEIEDKLTVQGQRTNLGLLFAGFRAASLGEQVETAEAYLSEYLGHVGGQFEVSPSATWHWNSLEIAGFMLEYGDASNGWLDQGGRIRDQVNEGLSHLVQQGYDHPNTWFGLAQARMLSGDQDGALQALEQAVEGGFRDSNRLMEELALKPLHGHPHFVDLAERIENEVQAQRQTLASAELEPYRPLQQRQPIAMSRAQLERYTGYYTDGNVVVHCYLDEKGQFTAFPGQFQPIPLMPSADGEFFNPASAGMTLTMHMDETGEITHAIIRTAGEERRFKVTDPPPVAVEIDHDTLERYTGMYDARLVEGQDEQAATDVWSGRVEIDEEGEVWIDWDNQSAKKIVPYSETEFYTPGFIQSFRFELDDSKEKAHRMIMIGDGTELVFERRED